MNRTKDDGAIVTSDFSQETSIDVLIPFHRVDKYLLKCLDSVNKTKGLRVRVILIDDRKSSDVEANTCEEYQELTSRLYACEYVVVKANGGSYASALNLGSAYVKSDFVSILNSDDLSSPSRLARQVKRLNCERADVCVGRIVKFGVFGKLPSLLGSPNLNLYSSRLLLLGAYGADASVVVRSAVWREYFIYNEQAKSADIELALRVYKKLRVVGDNNSKYFYRIHKYQVTSKISKTNIETFEQYFPYIQDYNRELSLPNLNVEEYLSMAAPWLRVKGNEISWDRIALWQNDYLQTFSDLATRKEVKRLLQRRNVFLWVRGGGARVNFLVLMRVTLEFIYLSLFGRAR